MPGLQRSGSISLDDIHVAAGGTSGTQCSLADSDIRSMLNKQLIDLSGNPTGGIGHFALGNRQHMTDYYGADDEFYIETGNYIHTVTLPSTAFNARVSMQKDGVAKVAAYTMIDIEYNLNNLTYRVAGALESPGGATSYRTGNYSHIYTTDNAGPQRIQYETNVNPNIGGNTSATTGTILYGGIGEIEEIFVQWNIVNADQSNGDPSSGVNTGLSDLVVTYLTDYTESSADAIEYAVPNKISYLRGPNTSDSDYDVFDVHNQDLGYGYATPNIMVPSGGKPNKQRFKIMVWSDSYSTTQAPASLKTQGTGERIELAIQFRTTSGSSGGASNLVIRNDQSSTLKELRANSFEET